MNLTWVCVLQALNHSHRSVDISRHKPRRISSREMAMTIPVLSSGMSCCNAYETASALPSRASSPFSERGCSWIPLCSTPLLRLLVSLPTPSCCSRTTRRRGLSRRRRINSLAIAHPMTPPPTMQTSYVFIGQGPSHPGGGCASSTPSALAQSQIRQYSRAVSASHRCFGFSRLENSHVWSSIE